MVHWDPMKIYFTSSTAEFETYKNTYFDIRNFLVHKGHVLTRDWLPHTAERITSKKTDLSDVKEIYQACLQAIKEADLVIIEDTVSNFSTGHQITIALQFKKPTLVLWQGRKHRHFNQMFIHGIESDMLQVSEYTPENFKDIIRGFIKQYGNAKEKSRFHLILNNVERRYLDWAQFIKNKSRTTMIREALRKEMENDLEYKNYLTDNKESSNNIKFKIIKK